MLSIERENEVAFPENLARSLQIVNTATSAQILVQWHDKEENIVNLWLSLHLVLENQARTLRSQWTVLGCILIVLNENLAV